MSSSSCAMLHIADAHVKQHIWQSCHEVVGDAQCALFELGPTIKKHGIEVLLLSGDIFDSTKPTAQSVNTVVEFCKQFREVLFITGTHDNTDPPWINVVPNAAHLGSTPTEVCGAHFYGIDYCSTRDQLKAKLCEIVSTVRESVKTGKPTYLVLHNAFRHLLGFEGAWKVEIEDIEEVSPALRVIVGDVHTRKTVELEGGGWVHSAGPLVPQDWGQTETPCYVDIIDVQSGSITPVNTDVRSFRTLEVEDVANFVDAPKKLPTCVRVLMPAGNTQAAPTIPGCIVIPQIVSRQEQTDGREFRSLGISLEQAIREEFKDPYDAELMWRMYLSENPREVIEEELKKNNIKTRN